ncbi:hypothetical protein LINGRAHAP2_LOCUS16724 [Linum grandiflorum]
MVVVRSNMSADWSYSSWTFRFRIRQKVALGIEGIESGNRQG